LKKIYPLIFCDNNLIIKSNITYLRKWPALRAGGSYLKNLEKKLTHEFIPPRTLIGCLYWSF